MTRARWDALVTEEDLEWALHIYRELHAHPELSGEEHQTAQRIERALAELGLDSFRCAGTGVVAVQENGAGAVLAFRADIDALPIVERTGLPYASRIDGVMHACGHDLHAAVALLAIRVLKRHPSHWSGQIVWIFQPAEETAQGAAGMIADGLWERAPRPSVVLAQHAKAIPVGTFLIGEREIMNLADSWQVTLRGRAAHASRPHEAIDPIVLASHVVVRLQGVVSRELAPDVPAVVTVGTFHAGTKENVIPDEAVISLNIRTPHEAARSQTLGAVKRIISAEVAASGAPPAEYEVLSTFPRCFNHPERASIAAATLEQSFGEGTVTRGFRATGSEDVGCLADSIDVPLVFWFFGVYGPAGDSVPEMAQNHTSYFAPDAPAALAAGGMAALAVIGSQLSLGHGAVAG